MTRKPAPAPEATSARAHEPGHHPHVLPSSGGCYVLVDGQPTAEPPAGLAITAPTIALTTDPEV